MTSAERIKQDAQHKYNPQESLYATTNKPFSDTFMHTHTHAHTYRELEKRAKNRNVCKCVHRQSKQTKAQVKYAARERKANKMPKMSTANIKK